MLIQEEFDERFETHIEKNKCKINSQMLPGWGDEQAVFHCSMLGDGNVKVIGERAKRARQSQVCSIENRGYIYNFNTMVECRSGRKCIAVK